MLKGESDGSCFDDFFDLRDFFDRERPRDESEPDDEKRLEDELPLFELLLLLPRLPRLRFRRDLRPSPLLSASSVDFEANAWLPEPFSISRKSMLKFGRWRPLDKVIKEERAS